MKVSTSRTSSYFNPLLGRREYVTRTYAHPVGQQQPHAQLPVRASKWSRFARFTGMSPFNATRFGWFAWTVFTLWLIGTLPALGYAFVVVSAAVFAGLRWRRSAVERAARVPRSVSAGPAWCDHCADWTVHDTDHHAGSNTFPGSGV